MDRGWDRLMGLAYDLGCRVQASLQGADRGPGYRGKCKESIGKWFFKKKNTHTQRKNNVIDKHCHFSAFKDKLTPVFMAVT